MNSLSQIHSVSAVTLAEETMKTTHQDPLEMFLDTLNFIDRWLRKSDIDTDLYRRKARDGSLLETLNELAEEMTKTNIDMPMAGFGALNEVGKKITGRPDYLNERFELKDKRGS